MIAYSNKNKFIVSKLEKQPLSPQEHSNCSSISTVEISIIFLGLFYMAFCIIKSMMEESPVDTQPPY